MSRPIVVIDCMLGPSESWGLNSTHIHGTHVPVEEPSTASTAEVVPAPEQCWRRKSSILCDVSRTALLSHIPCSRMARLVMRLREIITLLGGAAVAQPFAARSQPTPAEQDALPVIGFLNDLSPDQWSPALTALRRALSDAGYVEGRNVAFTYRWTERRREQLPTLAADLVRARVAVIV